MLLTLITGPRIFAQQFTTTKLLKQQDSSLSLFSVIPDRGKNIVQFNEYTITGDETGNFFRHPLLLNGKPLNYNEFGPDLKGELTVVKGAPITGDSVQVAFYVYLRRDGNKVPIPGDGNQRIPYTKIEISRILIRAKPGDQLVIEAVNRADGNVKRILKLPDGC